MWRTLPDVSEMPDGGVEVLMPCQLRDHIVKTSDDTEFCPREKAGRDATSVVRALNKVASPRPPYDHQVIPGRWHHTSIHVGGLMNKQIYASLSLLNPIVSYDCGWCICMWILADILSLECPGTAITTFSHGAIDRDPTRAV